MDSVARTYPERWGEPDCPYYLRTGACGFGVKCRFNHPANTKPAVSPDELSTRIGKPDCQHYMKTGTCRFGASCKFHHPLEKVTFSGGQVELNLLGLPMRLGKMECMYYMRTGSCNYGLSCKFHHPQPTSTGTSMSLAGFNFHAAPGIPATHFLSPCQEEYSSISMQGFPCIHGAHVQGFPSYVPVVISACGTVTPGSITYQSPVCPSSLEGLQLTSTMYDIQKQAESKSASSGISLPQADKESGLPERSGEPNCQYYMRTGLCKFGSSCKFHHPKDRKAQKSPCILSVLGLPLRMGQPPCAFYTRYGICKFGPTCKFDHPIAYGSVATSLCDTAVIQYPRASSPNSVLSSKYSSETSQKV